jgi:nucleotide-binding universal stress UspA family protein
MLADTAPIDYARLVQELETRGRRELDATVTEDDRRELNAQAILLTSIGAAHGIVSYAERTGIDLVVMGTHGRSGWSHLVAGSVAERVVRAAPCPVLTVRHPEHEFVAPDALQLAARSDPGSRLE